MEVFLVLSTAGSEKEGRRIARQMVKDRLAACVNVVPGIWSLFFWEGKICEEGEVLILAKTKKRLRQKIIKKINELHSYTVPEIIFLRVAGGDKKYLTWVGKTIGKKNKKNY